MPDRAYGALMWDDFCALLDRPSSDSSQSFCGTKSEKRLLEVWCMKLNGLHQLCDFLADEHEQTHRARGVITPEQVFVQLPERRASALPMYWAATVSMARRENGQPPLLDEDMPIEMAASLAPLPARTDVTYAAPQARDWPMGRTIAATVLIQAADPIPGDDLARMKGLIRLHLIADGLNAEEFSARDVFRVPLALGESRGAGMGFWTRKVESPERGIIVVGQTASMSLDEWNMVTRTVGTVRSSVEIGVYRAVSPADDIYSCGMLLLRTLCRGGERRWTEACEHLPSILEALQPVVQGLDEDEYAISARIRDRVREFSTQFEAGASIPEPLWWDAVVAVLRACSNIRGFSYVSHAGTYDPSPVRRLAQELESLARRARIELFDTGERDGMMLRACDRAMDHLVAGVS